MKLGELAVPTAQIPDRRGEIVGGEVGVALVGGPDFVDRLAEPVAQLLARRDRVRAVVGQREVELQHLGREALHGGVLPGVDAVGGPDEEAEHQRREQRQETDDGADHVARSGRSYVSPAARAEG